MVTWGDGAGLGDDVPQPPALKREPVGQATVRKRSGLLLRLSGGGEGTGRSGVPSPPGPAAFREQEPPSQ